MAQLGIIWADGIWNTAIWNTAIWAQEDDGLVAVPDVVGETEGNAITAIEAVNLVVVIQRSYHPTVPEGEVISQDPAASTEVAEGSDVEILVSRGVAPASTGKRGWTYGFGFGFGKRQ